MNAAKLSKSLRLQRVDKFLSDGQRHTTREIVRGADVCAVNSIVAELRANGLTIETRQAAQGIFYYRKVIEMEQVA